MQKFIEAKIPLTSIIGWILGAVALTTALSTAYGEQKQKLVHMSERQSRIEASIDRIEAFQHLHGEMLARIEAQLSLRAKPK